MSALAGSLLLKAAPYLAVALVIAGLVVAFLRNRTRRAEDKMAADRDRELNQTSQLNSVKTVEEDMAKATANRPSTDDVAARLKDGSF